MRTSFLRPAEGKERDLERGLGKGEKFQRNGFGTDKAGAFDAYFSLVFPTPPPPGFPGKPNGGQFPTLSNLFRDCSLKEPKYFHLTGALNALRVKFRSPEPGNFERPTIAECQTFAFPSGGHVCLPVRLFLHEMTVKLVLE